MISNLFDENIARILSFLLISPGSRHIRKELKEKTEMNNVPLDNSLNKLLSLNILKQDKNLIYLNHESEFVEIVNRIKKEYSYFNLPLKIYGMLTSFTNKLLEIKGIEEVYLFGSYSKLIYSDKSDIDIAVIFENKEKDKIKLENRIEKISEKISKRNNKKIEVHFFSYPDMKAKDSLIKDILRNGKKLI